MLYKCDFYNKKAPTVGRGMEGDTPSHTLPPLGRFAPSPRTWDKYAPFETLPLQNSKCSARVYGLYTLLCVIPSAVGSEILVIARKRAELFTVARKLVEFSVAARKLSISSL